MIGSICHRLNAMAPHLGLPPLRGGLVIGIDRHPAAKVTLLLFSENGTLAAVAKVARTPTAEAALADEHAVLEALATAGLTTVRDQVPRSLLVTRVDGTAVLVATALSGSPMSVRYYTPGHVRRPNAVAEDLRWAGDWLGRFQQETWAGVVSAEHAFHAYGVPAFDRYRDTVGWGAWEERLLDSLSSRARELSDTPVPLTACHGDYAIGNILVDNRGVTGVVDWERGQSVGLPFTDVFKFVGSYGSFLDRAQPPRSGAMRGHGGWAAAHARWGGDRWTNLTGFLYAYLGEGWFPDLVRDFVHVQLDRLGVPAAALSVFLPAFVADQVTALEDESYRQGYQALLRRLATEELSYQRFRVAG